MNKINDGGGKVLKHCTRCNKDKEKSEFTIERRNNDGLSYTCTECHKKRLKEYRKTDSFKEANKKGQIKYARKYPEKIQAQLKVRYKKNKLMKNECQTCGSSNNLQMHHPDYSQPILVMTLCASCHRNLHTKKEQDV